MRIVYSFGLILFFSLGRLDFIPPHRWLEARAPHLQETRVIMQAQQAKWTIKSISATRITAMSYHFKAYMVYATTEEDAWRS